MSSSRILVAPPTASLVQAADVTARLGISRASLYAYVSRGLIRSYASPDDPRQRLYAMDDVDALLRRRTRQRRPAAAAATALDWGLPVLETGITQIRDGRPFYRGHDAIALAEHASLEDTARILMPDLAAELFSTETPRAPVLPIGVDGPAGFLGGAIRCLNALEPPEEPVAPAVSTILRLVAAAASGTVPDATPIHRHLAQAWRAGSEAVDPIRRALVLSADHELSTSAFAVRVVASTGATLSKAVIAGLAALSGPRHGGMTDRVRAFFATMTGRQGHQEQGRREQGHRERRTIFKTPRRRRASVTLSIRRAIRVEQRS
jgi:citrate synthase